MRAHAFLIGSGVEFSETDTLLTDLLASAARWLGPDEARRARLGLHELLVNIRNHAYDGGSGAIDVGMTATSKGVTITVTDWGRRLDDAETPQLPHLSEGGYGLAIIEASFDDVDYQRATGRNQWTLRLRRGEQASR